MNSSVFNTSITLQNEIAKLLSNNNEPDSNDNLFDETLDNRKNIFNTDNIKNDLILEDQQPKPIKKKHTELSTDDKIEFAELANTNDVTNMTASEIIYRALLNNNESDLAAKSISGGNDAEEMINNITMTGGNVNSKRNSTNVNTNNLIVDEMYENKFTGGGFVNAFNKYKSLHNAINEQSSTSSSSSDNEDLRFNNIPKGFIESKHERPTFIKNTTENEEEDNIYTSHSDMSSSSSYDDFLQPDEEHDVMTKHDKKQNAKYIHLINSFKNQKPKSSYQIIGGAVNRPKTVTVVNAFPYIIKTDPTK